MQATITDKVSRIAKLLALAEGATGPEAEAALAKAQEMATLHAIDLEVARRQMADSNKRETPLHKRVSFDDAIATRNTKKSLVYLFMGIAHANDCKVNIFHDSTGVVVFGMPSDIDLVERMFGVVAVQMISGANAYLKTKAYRNETVTYYDSWGFPETKRVDGRTARLNYYNGFISSISPRLMEMKKQAEQSMANNRVTVGHTSDGHSVTKSVELVLIEKKDEVTRYYVESSQARGSWTGSSSSAYSRSASSAGTTDGRKARLGRDAAIGGSRTALH